MISAWKKEKIDSLIEKLIDFYEKPIREYFSGSNKIEELTNSELEYFNSKFKLHELVQCEPEVLLNNLLSEENKLNFALYLLRSNVFQFEVNHKFKDVTTLQQLVTLLLNKKHPVQHDLLLLLKRGYNTQYDGEFIRKLYKEVNSSEKLVAWSFIRFAYLLNDAELFEILVQNQMPLLTIVSFKLKKPVGIGYPNMLGIANNAFLHYRAHGDIILEAMKHYGIYDDVIVRDHKKSFQYRLDDYHTYKPIQDEAFDMVIRKILPELNTSPASYSNATPQTGQNL